MNTNNLHELHYNLVFFYMNCITMFWKIKLISVKEKQCSLIDMHCATGNYSTITGTNFNTQQYSRETVCPSHQASCTKTIITKFAKKKHLSTIYFFLNNINYKYI